MTLTYAPTGNIQKPSETHTIWSTVGKRLPGERGAPIAQLVKRWPTDLAVPGSSPARGEIFSM